tara:strand:- start:567 stop:1127 length:561 start_codon:yes stop_codon:yes gene_type:complete
MNNLCLLCSGYGRGVINLIKNKNKLNFNIELVILPKDSSDLINIVISNNINYELIDNSLKLSRKNELVYSLLKEYNVDFLFLVGCDFRIKGILLDNYKNKIINIHPSLLPSFKGPQNGIQQAMNYGVIYSGITIHFIDEEFDKGKIISQVAIKIENLSFEEIDNIFVKEGLNLSIETLNKLSKLVF